VSRFALYVDPKADVAAALMANAADLLAVAPEIQQPTVLADKLPA
jgi:hypothetical protein